jgi:transcription elongation factor Elf1
MRDLRVVFRCPNCNHSILTCLDFYFANYYNLDGMLVDTAKGNIICEVCNEKYFIESRISRLQ